MTEIIIRIPERTTAARGENEQIKIALWRCKLESCQMPIDHAGFCSKEHNNEFHHLQRKLKS